MDVKTIIKQLTLQEKASLCSGKNVWETRDFNRLQIPSIMMADGPHGLRKQYDNEDSLGINRTYQATCFPTASTVACSFDRELLARMGEAIANECIKHEVDILLGPGINIKRSPLCGRNFEYFSEDPYLTGELGAAFVKRVQDKGIGVSVKHYAVNNQETNRQVINAVVDKRALNEIYLSGFHRIMKEKPYTVMASYNKVNGYYACEHKELLTKILRNEWGFDGVVISDWGAVNDRVLGLKNGLDIEMPSSHGLNEKMIIQAVLDGLLLESTLDQAVERILNLIFKCHNNEKIYEEKDHHELARKIASESMVLLKNEAAILPLKEECIGIIGALAKTPRYQGSGSSKINPIKVDNIIDVLTERQISFKYSEGYELQSDKTNDKLLKDAIQLAKEVKIPVLFIGLTENDESEGFDRTHLHLPYSHNVLVEEIAKVNPNVVVVLSGGAPVVMPWLNQVKGLLNAYLGGEAGHTAIVDILFGQVNPNGKLAETYPLSLSDTPSYLSFPGGNRSVHYLESIYVGYRYYEQEGKDVLFPFGYGLSYTRFTYEKLTLSSKVIQSVEGLTLHVTIKNVGDVPGKEIVQVYVREVNPTVYKARKELKGFLKVELGVNEEKTVTITIDQHAFAYYDSSLNKWMKSCGEYEILVGSSSKDIHLKETIIIQAEAFDTSLPKEYHYTLDEFTQLIGQELSPLDETVKRPFHLNSPMKEIRRTIVGKLLVYIALKEIRKKTKGEGQETTRLMMERSFLDLPLRSFISFAGDRFNRKTSDALLLLINGRYIKGIMKLIRKEKRVKR